MTVLEDQLWDKALTEIEEGEVVGRDGAPLKLRTLIQRRWGWPKSAADLAATVLRQRAAGVPVRLYLTNPERHRQATELMSNEPEILKDLLSGMARGKQREARDPGRQVQAIMIRFDRPISDDGLLTALLQALGNRLGCSVDEVREVTDFGTFAEGREDHIVLEVRATEFES